MTPSANVNILCQYPEIMPASRQVFGPEVRSSDSLQQRCGVMNERKISNALTEYCPRLALP